MGPEVVTRPAKPERSTRGAKRDRVIAEAARTLNRYGVSKASLPLIAEQLGVSRAAIYYYVEDQEDLVFQSYLRSCDALSEYLATAEGGGGTALEIVERFIDVALAPSNPELAALSDMAYLNAERQATVHAAFNAVKSRLAEILALGIARGEIRSCTVSVVSPAILSLTLWLPIAKMWRSIDNLTHVELVDAIKTMLRQGIAADRQGEVAFKPLPLTLDDGQRLKVFDTDALAVAKQESLLAAASWLFNLKGVDATSLDEIAASVGATKRVIYHNLGDKETLIAACYSRSFRLYESVARQCEALPGPRVTAIAASVYAYAEAGLREDIATYTPVTGFGALPAALQDEVNASTVRLMDSFIEMYEQGQREGSIRPLNPRAIIAVNPGTFQWLPKWYDTLSPAERALAPLELADLNRLGLLPA